MLTRARCSLLLAVFTPLVGLAACDEAPKGYGKGLPSSDDTSSDNSSTETPTSTDDQVSTDTDSGTDGTDSETSEPIDTSNERTDPNQWPGYTWTYHRLTGCHGELDYHVWTYQGQAEATLVFANGRTEYTDKYHHIVTPIGKPWNIIMWDHYGHGRSEGVRTWVEDYESYYVCDMKKIVDEVATPLGKPLLLLAHSMGAGIGTLFMEEYPGVFKSAAFSSPMYLVDSGSISADIVRDAAEKAIAEGKSQEPFRPQPPIPPCETNLLTHDCVLYDKFKEDPLALIGDPAYGWIKATYDILEPLIENAPLIDEPIYIMQAGDEQVVVEQEQNNLCDALNAAKPGACTLEVYPGDWHELLREVDRQRVIDDAVAFLSQSLPTRREK